MHAAGQPRGSVATTVLLCLVFISIVLGMFYYSVTRTPVATPEQLAEAGVVIWPTPRELQPFALQTADGADFGNAQLRGHWSFLFFGFTNCPDICPVTLSEMAQARRLLADSDPELASQFRGLMVTVDPDRDTPDVLGAYVGAFGADFAGVYGAHGDIARFAQDVNVAFAKMPSDEGPYTVDHTGNIVIVNPMGHYHGFIKLPHKADTIAQAFQAMALSF
jgi:protein SCO1/2